MDQLGGYGKVNRLALLTCGLILLSVTTECLGLGYVLSVAECDLDISISDRGFLGAATLIGLVVPSILWGYLADVFGRRRVMLPPLLAAVGSTLCSALAVNFWNMFLLRLLSGLLLSSSCSTVYVYLGELNAQSHRASAIAWASAFIAGSFFSMPAIAWIFIPSKWSFPMFGSLRLVPWRAYICSWVVWSGLAAAGLCLLPESPRYLLATEGPQKARAVLAHIYACNHNKLPADYPVTEIVTDTDQGPRPSFKETILRMKYMVRPPLLRCVLISHYCNFLVFMKISGFSFWMPHIINQLMHNPATAGSMCTIMNANIIKHQGGTKCTEVEVDTRIYPIFMASGALTGLVYVGLGFVMVKWGTRTVFCGLMLVCSACVLAAGVAPHTHVAVALLAIGVCGIAASGVLAAVAVEVFPTSLRALALCTLFMVGRLGGALGAHIVGLAMVSHCTPIVVAVTAVAGGSSLLMALWPDAAKVRSKMEAEHFIY